jgi:hypothetical protein
VAAVLVAVSVIVLVVDVLVGLNDPLTPVGSELTDRFTLLLKLFCAFTLTAAVAVEP